jgi:glycosyltransferase involved in cell wall biosynthesis
MEKYGITEEDKILLFVGRLHYLKGIDILIRNLIPLLSKQKKWKLFIVGRDDGCEDELKSLIPVQLQKQIIFTGPLYGDGVTHIYSLASCYIMTPRYFEETSTAALEALSIGVPVVTTREAQIPFLDSYKAGFTLEKDLSNIHLKVKTLLSANKKNTGLYKSQARKLVEEKFEISAITQRLLTYIV